MADEIPKEKPDKATLDAWHDDPASWRMGIFYYNPKDKRIFPPKRLKGLGWTINFANPYSMVVAIIGIVAIYLVMNFFFTKT